MPFVSVSVIERATTAQLRETFGFMTQNRKPNSIAKGAPMPGPPREGRVLSLNPVRKEGPDTMIVSDPEP